jgi:hypothetical protein
MCAATVRAYAAVGIKKTANPLIRVGGLFYDYTSSMMTIGAASPRRVPSFRMRV